MQHTIVVVDDHGRITGDKEAKARSLRALSRADIIFVYSHLLEAFFLGDAFAATRKANKCGGFQLISHNGDDAVGPAIASLQPRQGVLSTAAKQQRDIRPDVCGSWESEDGVASAGAVSGQQGQALGLACAKKWEQVAVAALDSSHITRWWAQNSLATHPRVWPVPIGVANSMWRHGDTAALGRAAMYVDPNLV